MKTLKDTGSIKNFKSYKFNSKQIDKFKQVKSKTKKEYFNFPLQNSVKKSFASNMSPLETNINRQRLPIAHYSRKELHLRRRQESWVPSKQ